jgi:hypothetical protein
MEAKPTRWWPLHLTNLPLPASSWMQNDQKSGANPFLLLKISQSLKKAL